MDSTTNSLNWFEIPVLDLPRAKHFYQMIFSIHMEEMDMGKMQMASFPAVMNSGKASGALVKSGMHVPSADGVVLYLNANPNLEDVLSKVETNGGKVLIPKTQITPELGFMAFFMDTEGNRVALHSQG